MAWSWSHTDRAYHNAQRQMEQLDRETRETIAAEWLATPKDEFGGYGFSIDMDMKKYYHSEVRVKQWSDKKLNGFIWERMEELATCTNGGWEAYCCPHGCGPHMVPFDPPKAPRSENPLYRIEVKGVGVMARYHEEEDADEMFEDWEWRSRFNYGSKAYGRDISLFEGEAVIREHKGFLTDQG